MVALRTGSSTSEITRRSKSSNSSSSNNAVKSNKNNKSKISNDSNITPSAASSSSWWKRSAASAFRGGISGSIAMVLQVVLLMWLRTVVNYQYKHGVGIAEAFRTLYYEEGGIPRFYRGASVALLTGPISRFGDTAANEGIRELFGISSNSNNSNSNRRNSNRRKIPVWAITLLASMTAAMWRVVITPLDTIKTTLQVNSDGSAEEGWNRLASKIRDYGIFVLWDGAFGNWFATLAGHYPWFIVNNWLEQRLPMPQAPQAQAHQEAVSKYKEQQQKGDQKQQQQQQQKQRQYQRMKLIRRAFIGFCSSVASDCISNGIRVVKTYKQTSNVPLTYLEALSELFHAHGGYNGYGFSFVLRGLGLKVVSNGLSGILFSVLWKMIMERMSTNTNSTSSTNENSNNNNNNNNNNNKEIDDNDNDIGIEDDDDDDNVDDYDKRKVKIK